MFKTPVRVMPSKIPSLVLTSQPGLSYIITLCIKAAFGIYIINADDLASIVTSPYTSLYT